MRNEIFDSLSENDKEFVLDQLFNEETDCDGNAYWWRSVAGGGEGYIVVWSNGCVHTYNYPPDTWG